MLSALLLINLSNWQHINRHKVLINCLLSIYALKVKWTEVYKNISQSLKWQTTWHFNFHTVGECQRLKKAKMSF